MRDRGFGRDEVGAILSVGSGLSESFFLNSGARSDFLQSTRHVCCVTGKFSAGHAALVFAAHFLG
jgi:hypothetical protein